MDLLDKTSWSRWDPKGSADSEEDKTGDPARGDDFFGREMGIEEDGGWLGPWCDDVDAGTAVVVVVVVEVGLAESPVTKEGLANSWQAPVRPKRIS